MKLKVEVSAGGIVYKNDTGLKLWLVIQHSRGGHWSFPKGHIGDKIANEQKEAAALREVEEEGGVKAKIISDEPVSTQYMYRRGEYLHKKTVYYFLMEYASGDPADHDHEVSEAKFISAAEVRKVITYETDLEAFEKILKII